jgi:hypothetical protein
MMPRIVGISGDPYDYAVFNPDDIKGKMPPAHSGLFFLLRNSEIIFVSEAENIGAELQSFPSKLWEGRNGYGVNLVGAGMPFAPNDSARRKAAVKDVVRALEASGQMPPMNKAMWLSPEQQDSGE